MRTNAVGWLPFLFATSILIAAAGCSDVFGNDGLGITITLSGTVVTPDQPVTVTVTVMNLGDSVVWGIGSSTCQLSALALVGSDEYRIDGGRICTEDLSVQGLARGESISEHWPWGGEVVVDGAPSQLPPTTYGLVAVAGTVARSETRVVQVGSDESP